MKTTRPVFESFTAFVNNLYEMESRYPGFLNSLNEEETTYASPLLKLLKGSMKLAGQSATEVDTLVLKTFNKIFTDNSKVPDLFFGGSNGKVEMENIIELLTEAFGLIRNSSGLATVPGSVTSSEIPTEYKYLQSGNVRGKDLPEVDGSSTPDMSTESLDVPLPVFLLTLNAHNLITLYNLITGAKNGKAYVNAGSEANFDQFDRKAKENANDPYNFLEIDTTSLAGELITLKPYVSTYVKIDAAKIKDESKEAKAKREKEEKEKLSELNKIKYGWQFPLYGLSETAITPLGGELIDASYYDKVIEPAGNDVPVEDQEYSAPPESSFFPADGVIISKTGIQALNLILSEFNSIKTIKVNGGASSSATTRAGGNEKLAKDRMLAGIAQLNLLKKNKVKQLENAVISEGIASVQASGASDPKQQQVTFTISGMIKTIKVTPKKAVTIPTMETVKADSVKFTKYIFQLNLNEEPNARNMAERA